LHNDFFYGLHHADPKTVRKRTAIFENGHLADGCIPWEIVRDRFISNIGIPVFGYSPAYNNGVIADTVSRIDPGYRTIR